MAIDFFYINLLERVDRNNFFISQFQDSVFELKRISAIDVKSVTSKNFCPPEVAACWLSHKKAYKLFLQSNSTHAVIFEDDCIINNVGLFFLKNLNSVNLFGIDLLQFGYLLDSDNLHVDSGSLDYLIRIKTIFKNFLINNLYKYLRIIPIFKTILLEKYLNDFIIENKLKLELKLDYPLIANSFEAGAHGYIISKRLAEKLVKFNDPTILAADLVLIEIANSKKYNCYRVGKSLAYQEKFSSNINTRSTKFTSSIMQMMVK